MLERISPHLMSTHRRGGLIQGCLIVLSVILLLAIIGGVVVFMYGRQWIANGTAAGMRALIQESDLPASEKPEINAIIDEVRDDFKAGNITLEEIGTIFADFGSSSVLATGAALQFQALYVAPSKLSDEEKAAAGITFDRLAQAISEGKVKWENLDEVLKPIAYDTGNNNIEFQKPEAVSDDELRTVIGQAQAAADAAGVPAEVVKIDLSDEFRHYIEGKLGRPLGTPPGTTPALPEPQEEPAPDAQPEP
ncbi:MAG: hypothetical protein DYG94_04140 [Leptolyngbya sp. PLA3]|nr:MAG: hypothetical protein EDM82_07760 [Cyanobacteria bacterium CYA]MCE7967921.1 hypothetical protein [Leptolyngbya sp. PL-A3]